MTAPARLNPQRSGRLLAISLCFFALLTITSWSGALLGAVAGLVTAVPLTESVITLVAVGTTFTVLALVILVMQFPGSPRASLRSAMQTYAAAARELVDHLGLLSFRSSYLVWTAGATAVAVLAAYGIHDLIPSVTDPDDPRFTSTAHLSPVMTGVSWGLQGASEEWLFRGPVLMVAGLASRRRRALALTIAVIATSLAFGLIHTHAWPSNALHAGTSGVVFALLALKTRSIWPPLLAHAATNLFIGLGN